MFIICLLPLDVSSKMAEVGLQSHPTQCLVDMRYSITVHIYANKFYETPSLGQGFCNCVCGDAEVTVVIKNRITDLIYSQDEKIDIKY